MIQIFIQGDFFMRITQYFDLLLSQRKVSNQLIIIFMLALILPVTFISFLLLYDSQKSLNNHYKEQTYSDNLRVKSILFDITTNIHNTSEKFVMDNMLLHLLTSTYSSPEQMHKSIDSYTGFEELLKTDTSIASIKIYTNNATIGNYEYFQQINSKIRQNDWFQMASNNATAFWKSIPYKDDGGHISYRLTFFRKIILFENDNYAILSITVDNNYLKNRIYNNTLDSMITVNEDPIFYSNEKEYLGNPLPVKYPLSYYEKTGILSINKKNTIATISTLLPYKTTDQIYIITLNPNALQEVSQIQQGYILLLIIIIVILIFLFYLFSHYFSHRVLILRKSMKQASNGNYDIIDSFSGKDEFYEIFQDLKIMIQEIKEKEALIYENQLREEQIKNQQQQMEFKMLASQINPHFLYNTLETIRMKAFTSGNHEVATAIKLLGKSLRYVLDNTGTVSTSLEKELNHIRTYVQIQQLRFGNRVNYYEQIEEDIDLEEYKILPLLLQPIIENAISHGLEGEDDKKGKIFLHIYKDTSFLYIQISDNGIGMTQEELKNLQEKITIKDTTKTKSIGLYNIHQRMFLCYGSKCKLDISSTFGEKTTISLQLPLDKVRNL